MPLQNFLALYAAPLVRDPAPLRTGDVVFHISVDAPGPSRRWTARAFAHAGLVARDLADYQLGEPVDVFHMGRRVERDAWFDSVNGSRVDLAGRLAELDDSVRSRLIDKALEYFHRRPRMLSDHRSWYWMGEPQSSCHPRLPDENSAYGFSCSTFVDHCYSEVGQHLVDLESMPLTTARELQELRAVFRHNTQATPFRRLYPGYLIGAFDLDRYPFRPDNWDDWKDHGRYIPAHMLIS